MVVTFLVLRWSQREQLGEAIETDVEAKRLSTSGRIAGFGIIATGIGLIAASAFDLQLGLPTFVAGLLTVAIVLLVKREGPWATIKDISRAVIPLVAGLFVFVEALETTGVLAMIADQLKALAQRSDVEAGWFSGIGIAVACNLVNNLPAGLLAGAAVHAAHVSNKVAGGILVGVDLGPQPLRHRLARHDPLAHCDPPSGRGRRPPGPSSSSVSLRCRRPSSLRLPPSSTSDKRFGDTYESGSALSIHNFRRRAAGDRQRDERATARTPRQSLAGGDRLVRADRFVFVTLFFLMPTLETLSKMPWYAPLGGVAGAVAVFGGLAFIDKVGAAPFDGLALTANILTSLAMDAFGLFGLNASGFKPMPWLGGLLMAIGVVFIARTGGKSDEGRAWPASCSIPSSSLPAR